MREAVIRCFDGSEAWLTGVFEQAEAKGSLRVDGSPREPAPALVGGLEGAMLVVRPYVGVARFEGTANRLLASLASSAPAWRNVMIEIASHAEPTGHASVFLLGFVRIAADAGAVPKDAGLARRCGS